jgi:hypothetical protein
MSVSDKSVHSRRRFLQSAAVTGAGLTTSWPGMVVATETASASSMPGTAPDVRGANGRRETAAGCLDKAEVIAAVERSLANIMADGVDPNFPAPFELGRLRHDVDLQREVVALTIDYILHPAQRSGATASLHLMSMPKANLFGYRYFAQIDVLGATRYLATAILIAKRLEAARSPEQKLRVFSHRFLSEGLAIFDADCDYGTFLTCTLDKLDLRPKTFLVSADIANFYPSIDDARFLQNLRARGVEPWLTETLEDILSQWKSRWSHGFPVGPVASYLLAEAALTNVDAKLTNDGIDFIRYVDDYRFFTDDMVSARLAVGKLVEHLQAENLTLNQAKSSVEVVTSSEYVSNLNDRRMIRFWNQASSKAFDQIAQGSTAQPAPDSATPAKKDPSTPKKKNKGGTTKKPPCRGYAAGCSPFEKSQLDELDLAFLDQAEPKVLLSNLEKLAAEGKPVRLGDFRALIESACYRENYALIGDALSLLVDNPHCVIYLIDVLSKERDRIPVSIRRMASDWFAARLVSGRISDHEVMNVAMLFGVEGYHQPDAIYGYLQSDLCTKSPIATRVLLAALQDHCDSERAMALVDRFSRADGFVRRAILDLAWPHLDRDRKSIFVSKYQADFKADPFLRALLNGAAGPGPGAGLMT